MAKKKIKICGHIGPNSDAFFYRWFGMDYSCPRMVEEALNEANGDEVDVYVNSGGGEIASGSEIYNLLRMYNEQYHNVRIHIMGSAHSSASIVSMASWCEMAPTALMMVHCVSTYCGGNHNDFEHQAEVLRTADEALCSAYVSKSGMSRDEALAMMNAETWFTAEQALERGLIDKVMYSEEEEEKLMTASDGGYTAPSEEQLDYVREMMAKGYNSFSDVPNDIKPQADLEPVDVTNKQKMEADFELLSMSARKMH